MSSDFYERLSRAGWASLQQPRTRAALRLATGLRAETLLDIGCADGEVSLALGRLSGASVAGVDVSEVAVATSRARGVDAHQVDLDRDPLPSPDGSIDLVYMAEVIEHLAHPDRALEEVRRVLAPGGHLLLTTPNLACAPNRLLLLAGIQPLYSEVSDRAVLGRGWRAFGQGGEPVGHLRLYTLRALRELLQLHGFQVERVRGAGFHQVGGWRHVESVLNLAPNLAMQLVVLARKP